MIMKCFIGKVHFILGFKKISLSGVTYLCQYLGITDDNHQDFSTKQFQVEKSNQIKNLILRPLE